MSTRKLLHARRATTAFIAAALLVALVSVLAPNANAKPKERIGTRIHLFGGGLQAFPAGEPFHIAHGWQLETGDEAFAQGKYGFALAVDGVEMRHNAYDATDVVHPELGPLQARNWIYNFPHGMTGTHTFTGRWFGPCKSLVEGGFYAGPCKKPTQVVSAAPLTITVRFVGLVSPGVIEDNFSGDTLDSSVWWSGGNQPEHTAVSVEGGYAKVRVGAGATNDFSTGIGTRCKVRGDFEATVSYDLLEWPAAGGVWVSLLAVDTGGFNTYRASFPWFDGYGAYLPPAGTSVPASGTRDTLRLVREGSTWTGSYLSAGGWVVIASGPGPTTDTGINLGVFNVSGAAPFAGHPATIGFDDFSVHADAIFCPS